MRWSYLLEDGVSTCHSDLSHSHNGHLPMGSLHCRTHLMEDLLDCLGHSEQKTKIKDQEEWRGE